MFEEIMERLESVTATMIGGVFLLLSLILPMLGVDVPLYFNPAWITVLISGLPLMHSAIRKMIANKGVRKISSALLISTAMIAAIAIGDLFAAGEVAFIMAIGEILEHKTTERAKKGLKNLIGLTPQQGRRIRDDKEEMISVEEIGIGDVLRVLPGEAIPVDGEIINGESSVDQSIMTGESLPVDKGAGDLVYCGTMNRFGAIDIIATKVGEDSSLQKLIQLVKEAEGKKAPMQRLMDQWASWLVPVAFALAVLAGLVRGDVVVAVTVLVVFCPCALVLATPTAIMAAIGQATKHGIIIKSGEALEKMGQVDLVAFDKTGTLTYGKLEVSDVIALAEKVSEEEVIQLVASAEQKSEHPIGKAIAQYAKERDLPLMSVEEFRMVAGKGIYAKINGEDMYCGNEKYMEEQGIFVPTSFAVQAESLSNQGKALLFASKEEKVIGLIALCDTLKPEAKQMLVNLSSIGTDAVLLTGDNERAATYFAKQAGITTVRAELLPEEKVLGITELQNGGRTVCMIGDGVNDAPALKTADVGIAMGTMGSDIAVDAADIALMGDDISKIPYLKRLSNATVRTIKFGISLSLIINFLAIFLSFLGILNPTTGALVHNAGACLVVFIAALLYDRKFE